MSVHTWNFFANTAEGKQIISEISDQLSVSWNRVVNDIRTQISQAGQKEKKRKVPSQLDKGDGKMKTPDTDPNEWKQKGDTYTHTKTGWTAKKDKSAHGGTHWDISPGKKNGSGHLNVDSQGNIFGGSVKWK